MPSNPCASCGKLRPIFAEGKCHACYAEWGRANGIAEADLPVRCSIDDCDAYAIRRGLCDRHYRRVLDHGSTEKVRQPREERFHPEYKNWYWLKSQGRLCPEWQTFAVFVAAVGERPSKRHWLERARPSELYGPDNFLWRAPKLETEHSSNSREARRSYQKAIREQKPGYWIAANLKRYYGITREQYDELLARQGGTCALCERKEDVSAQGEPQLLAVDHNHATGEIRGLLCRNHNALLGHCADDPAVLQRAAEYLERAAHTEWFVPKAGEEYAPRKRAFALGGGCTVAGCDHPIKAKGLCATHYARFMRTGSTETTRRVRARCTMEGCGRPASARGLCHKHYERANRHGELPPKAETG